MTDILSAEKEVPNSPKFGDALKQARSCKVGPVPVKNPSANK